MDRPPRDPSAPLINFALFMRTGLVALCMTAGAFGIFHWELVSRAASLEQARTAVVNTIVAVEMVYLFNCRSLTHSVRSLGWFTNLPALGGIAAMALLQLAFTYLPIFNRLFHTAPLPASTWLAIAAVALAVFLIVGIEKWVRFSRHPGTVTAP